MATESFEARVLGVIEGATNPESAELLDDGETIVFGNCAMMVGIPEYRAGRSLVYLRGEAFISRARVSASGKVSLDERRLVEGLTGTLGCDILRKGTSRFPAGTVFIEEGGNPITDDCETIAKDTRPRALAFDPMTGEIRGEIPLWDGSAIGKRFNGIDQPNGIAIDSAGNLYVGDIPNSNPDPHPAAPPPVPPAVYRIRNESLDALADGSGGADAVERVVMPGYVNGLAVSPIDDVCWAVSCSPVDPVKGGIYRLPRDSFSTGIQPEPLYSGLGILDGVGVTRRGTVLASNPLTGEIYAFPTDGRQLVVSLSGASIAMPADFNVVYPKALDGEPALLVPDISVGKPPGTGQIAVAAITGL